MRGDFTPDSDLDIGFGNLNLNQATKLIGKIRKDARKGGGLKPEETKMVPGNKTDKIDEIQSPEEFFQRSGVRTEGRRKGERFGPSGSLTLNPDGSVRLIIPPS